MLKLGCSGYITKNNAGAHIINAIKAVVQGEQYFSSDVQKDMLQKYVNKKEVPHGDAPESFLMETLTDREIEVLRLITQEHNTPEIADKLNVSVSTIETHRKSLLKKLKVKNAVGLAMYAIKYKII